MKKFTPLSTQIILLFIFLPFFSTAQNGCLNVPVFGNQQCFDNGTPGDPTDDTWTMDINVTDPSGTGTSWILNDPLGTTGTYGQTTTIGPYSIDLDWIYMFAADAANPQCASFVHVAQNPCAGNSCGIGAALTAYSCSNGGTPGITSDDTFTYTFNFN